MLVIYLVYLGCLFVGDSQVGFIIFWFAVHWTFEMCQWVADYRTKDDFSEAFMARFEGWNLFDTARIYLQLAWILLKKYGEQDSGLIIIIEAYVYSALVLVSWICCLQFGCAD